jgi:hypothetical protein
MGHFRRPSSLIPVALSFIQIAVIVGCGSGGGGSTTPPPPPTITSVSVSPATANVQPGASKTFQAKVRGTGSYSSTVTWSVSGATGADVGAISSVGVYTAPKAAPNPNTVSVTAISQANTSESGFSSVVIGSAAYDITEVQILAHYTWMPVATTLQLSAVVSGTGTYSSAVSWMVNSIPGGNSTVGTIDANGLYKAPATVPEEGGVSIQAASVVAPSDIGILIVTIVNVPPPVIQQLSPAVANAGEQIQIIGTGFNGGGTAISTVTVYFTGPNGIQIPAVIYENSNDDTERTVTVPLSATSGPVSVTVQSDQIPQSYSSNSVQFTRSPRIRIRAPQVDLSSGESTTFQWKQIAGANPVTLNWSTDVGNIDPDGTYTAPSGITSDSFAVVTACVQGGTSCDYERLGLHPFRIAPNVPTVAAGDSFQLQGIEGGGAINPAWTLGGPGTLSTGGLYTATSQLADGGGILVTANAGAATETGQVDVTGQFPGMVNHVFDYVDYSKPSVPYASTFGTFPDTLAVVGNRLYTDSAFGTYSYLPPDASYKQIVDMRVMDVYDITDPVHPVWVDAIEPVVSGSFGSGMLVCDGRLFVVAGIDSSGGDDEYSSSYGSGAIGIYDLSGASPVPVQKALLPNSNKIMLTSSGCVLSSLNAPYGFIDSGPTAALTLYSFQSGGIATSKYSIPIPGLSSAAGLSVDGMVSDGKRLYLGINNLSDSPDTAYQLDTYDLTTKTPSLLSTVTADTKFSALSLVGNDLYSSFDTGFYYPTTFVYDVSDSTPQYLTQLPLGGVDSISGSKLLGGTYTEGFRVVDISNPQKPVVESNLFDSNRPRFNSVLAGNHFFDAEGALGFGVWDVSQPGGMLPTDESPQYLEDMLPTAIAGNATNAYVASLFSPNVGLLFHYDMTKTPPALVTTQTQNGMNPMALALSGTTLYEGGTTGLAVLDVSGSGSPTQVSSSSMNVSALAASNSLLLIGTGDNHLVVDNISQPQSPSQLSSVSLPSLPYQIAMSGNLALLADGAGGLLVYNISTPSSPQLVSSITQFPQVYGVAIDGTMALLAAREYGLVIVDLTNPASPMILGQAKLDTDNSFSIPTLMNNKAFSIAVSNKIAYVGVYDMDTSSEAPDNGTAMIYGFDYSNPAQPRLVSLSANGEASDYVLSIWTSGTEMLAGCSSAINAFDISQPRSEIGRFLLPAPLRAPQSSSSISPQAKPKGRVLLRAPEGATESRDYKFDHPAKFQPPVVGTPRQ